LQARRDGVVILDTVCPSRLPATSDARTPRMARAIGCAGIER
jgi:hypothetical protein